MQIQRFGLNPSRIHHILISHLHGDHVFGLPGLLSSLGMMGRKVPMNIYGPGKLSGWLEEYMRYFGSLPYDLEFHEVKEDGQLVYESNKLEVHSISMDHRVACYGYLFREKPRQLNVRKEQIEVLGLGLADVVKIKKGEDYMDSEGRSISNRDLTLPPYRRRSYAYLSDTRYQPELASRLEGVDLLFHEATFSDKDKKLAKQTLHSTTKQAAALGKKAGVGKLLIGHFSTRYKNQEFLEEEAREIFENTVAVKDGDRYSLPLERVSE